MKNLVPIKVKIGLNEAGQAKYPNFNSMQTVQNTGMDWSKYIDVHGSGWLYDECGHQDEDVDSPRGQQWGLVLVPKEFADEAVTRYPGDVTKLNETATQDFYDNKHAIEQPDEEIDNEVLQGIKLKQDLGQTLTKQQQDALDPNKEERGVRKNPNKKFVDFKTKRGFNIVQ